MNIGKTLRSLRIKKGISKNELCVKTGLNKGYVYRLENDLISPTLVTLEKISYALGEPLSAIIKTAERENAALYPDIEVSHAPWGKTAEDHRDDTDFE